MVDTIGNNTQTRTADGGNQERKPGPYIARVIKHADPYYLGGLEVELLKTAEVGNIGETLGQTVICYYASPFYGITQSANIGKNDNYSNTQKSYGFWAIPPDPGSLVLVIFPEGSREYGFWFACVPEKGMTFMLPGGQPSTEQLSGPVPSNLKGKRLPAGEYNKKITKPQTNNVIKYKRPVNEDFVNQLLEQGLVEDDIRGITSSSAQREFPSAVIGISSPGPVDKRGGAPQGEIGIKESKATVPVSRLGSSSFVIDDGDDKLIRKGKPADTPYEYINKEASGKGGDVTIPHNELIRFRTRSGAQVLLHTSEDLIYINNSRGTAWIEITSNGKIDIYAQDSISLHTENDINFVADRDINFEAGRNMNIIVNENIYTSCALNYELLVGVDGKLKFKNNLDTTVTNNMKTTVVNENYDIVVGTDMKIKVDNDWCLRVGNDLFDTAGNDIHLLANNRLNLTGQAGGIGGYSGGEIELTSAGYQHYKSGAEWVVNAGGTSNIKSSHHKETAGRIDMNGPVAATANSASPANEACEAIEAVLPIKAKFPQRVPQHEPWEGHENWNPPEVEPTKTEAVDTESQDLHFEDRPPRTDRTPMNNLIPED